MTDGSSKRISTHSVPLDSRSTYILHFLGSSYTKVRSYDGAAAAAIAAVTGKFVFRERKRFQRPTALSLFQSKDGP